MFIAGAVSFFEIIGYRLNRLHESLELRFADHNNVFSFLVEGACKQGFLKLQKIEYPFLDRRRGYKVDDTYCFTLTKPVYTANTLFKYGRVPWDVHINHNRTALQIQAHAAGISGEENHARWIFSKPGHKIFSLFCRDAAVKVDVPYSVSVQYSFH